MPTRLEEEFHSAMEDIYRRAREEAGYNATVFLKMLAEHGGLETARRLINAPPRRMATRRCGRGAALT